MNYRDFLANPADSCIYELGNVDNNEIYRCVDEFGETHELKTMSYEQ